MRFLHTADWHIGKKLYGYDLEQEQEDAFKQIARLAVMQKVDAVVIAGDLFDRATPSEDAVARLDRMIIQLNLKLKKPVLAISGNHDSAVRLNTGREWYKATSFFLTTALKDALVPVEFADTQFFLLPYFRAYQVRNLFDDPEITDTTKALQKLICEMKKNFDPAKKHVLVAHFFVIGSSQLDPEMQPQVGGLNAFSTDLLTDFDYVALGHLHDKNALKNEKVRYSGAPLKFSLAEAKTKKGVWIVDTAPFTCDFHEIKPLHDVVLLQGSYQELTTPEYYKQVAATDYVGLQLTDKAVIPNVINNLRGFYPRIINLERTAKAAAPQAKDQEKLDLSPIQLLQRFFTEMTDSQISSSQLKWARESLERIKTEGEGK
ncbi:exonuclease SbcCD subunit D [Liquorilactobacillus satsumensis]|uniref:exonuclease SbcCD subunit D n=1 Tax=Liquorilactobacillus satsumensis TaxID=259059 RepID=UPI0039E8FBA5